MRELLVLTLFTACVAQLDLSDMPKSLCGWPSLHEGGKFPEWNTRLAQYLLSYSLGNPIILPTGKFTSHTTVEIEHFQALNGLAVNGYLNIDTWPTLTALVSPLTFNVSSGAPVKALQDALNANGFVVDISGNFDENTREMLSAFQCQRGATETTGDIVDEQTWHLLATQCNISMPGHYWFDAGWPQGAVAADTFTCLRDHGFEYTVIECWREKDSGSFVDDCVDNVANAWKAGFETVDIYMYAERYRDPAAQANEMLTNLTASSVKFGGVMLDVEGDKWNEYTHEQNQQFMLDWRKVFDDADIPLIMYCGSQWSSYFGDEFTAFSDVPLVYAHYDNIPSFYDWDYAPYGGWEHPAGKQFYDGIEPEIVCGLALDWDWSSSPFWER